MAEITVVLPRYEVELKKIDITDEVSFDDDDKKSQRWFKFIARPDEFYFDDGEMCMSFSSGDVNYVSVVIPLGELLEQFARFDFFGSLAKYVEENADKIKKNKKTLVALKKFVDDL